ncbi:thiolase family protein [Lentilactobacillus sp. SPB1-3]|uniref:Acetyl-CoA C-acyltransferase n=1 Tax=Lentilactobacillus terminaliae TaxID=3003483 RepID=A0ACD5DF23_9LACO|nr:thiolase family protein [Lentilactobacillus sp. SPB1-3]MCZ0976236.1 thiolase family protein [Lentilactobacillus sp. SPB1-3]
MTKSYIIEAKRTPIGKFGGSLSGYSAEQLGTIATKEVIKSLSIKPNQIDQVIFGNAVQAGNGQNIARQIEINSSIPNSKTAFTVNQVCGSGMKAIHQAYSAIQLNEAQNIIAGGTESMSNAPFYNRNVRFGSKFGSINLIDGLEYDGLTDAFSHKSMGVTAENVADQFNVTRQEQDEYSLNSHKKASLATTSGYFNNEIIPITSGNTTLIQDEGIRFDTNLEKLAKLKPSFIENGTVTAGNSAPINDGASALLVSSEESIKENHLNPIAEIIGYSEVGIDPQIMGYAPYYAISNLLEKLKMTISDIDLFEINEAFASQSIAVSRDLQIPDNKLNISGGALALGHPLGDSGARIITTLINNLHRENKTYGIASLCMGGGMGAAIAIKAV